MCQASSTIRGGAMFTSGNSATIDRNSRYIDTAVVALALEYPWTFIRSAATPSKLSDWISAFASLNAIILRLAYCLSERAKSATSYDFYVPKS